MHIKQMREYLFSICLEWQAAGTVEVKLGSGRLRNFLRRLTTRETIQSFCLTAKHIYKDLTLWRKIQHLLHLLSKL